LLRRHLPQSTVLCLRFGPCLVIANEGLWNAVREVDELDLETDDGEDTVVEEGQAQGRQGTVEEVARWIVVARDLQETDVDAGHDRTAEDTTGDALEQRGVHPVKAVDVHKGIGGPKAHANDVEEYRGEEESLVQSQPVVRALEQFLDAALVRDVDDPLLRHGPVVNLTVVEDETRREEADAQEEEVKLVLAGALHYEAGLLAHLVDLSVEVQAEH